MDTILTDIFVLIPVYNCKDYIGNAVKSVIEQDYRQIQVVLIDDGSTDGSEKICDKLVQENDRIHVIHQDNAGVSMARNVGIDFVISSLYKNNNSYIAFLDADDEWKNEFFDNKVFDVLEKGHDLVGFQTVDCNSSLNRCRNAVPLLEGIYEGGKQSIELYRSQQFTGMLYSCEFIQRYSLRFECGMKYSEDRLFLMQCIALATEVALYNKILYMYRNNSVSAVHKRLYGIEYFKPIFVGYLEGDKKLQRYFNQDSTIGKGFVGWYIIDMMQEHYQHFGKRKEIELWVKKHLEWCDLIEKYGGERSVKIWNETQKYPTYFQVKNMVKGILRKFVDCMRQIPVVTRSIEKYRYPIYIGDAKER